MVRAWSACVLAGWPGGVLAGVGGVSPPVFVSALETCGSLEHGGGKQTVVLLS